MFELALRVPTVTPLLILGTDSMVAAAATACDGVVSARFGCPPLDRDDSLEVPLGDCCACSWSNCCCMWKESDTGGDPSLVVPTVE